MQQTRDFAPGSSDGSCGCFSSASSYQNDIRHAELHLARQIRQQVGASWRHEGSARKGAVVACGVVLLPIEEVKNLEAGVEVDVGQAEASREPQVHLEGRVRQERVARHALAVRQAEGRTSRFELRVHTADRPDAGRLRVAVDLHAARGRIQGRPAPVATMPAKLTPKGNRLTQFTTSR